MDIFYVSKYVSGSAQIQSNGCVDFKIPISVERSSQSQRKSNEPTQQLGNGIHHHHHHRPFAKRTKEKGQKKNKKTVKRNLEISPIEQKASEPTKPHCIGDMCLVGESLLLRRAMQK